MTVGVISHHCCSAHNMGNAHPESPQRMAAIQDQLIRSGLEYVIRQYDATPIEKSLLELVHDKSYIDHLYEYSPASGEYKIDDDTVMTPSTLKAALHSAGAAINAVDLVMSNAISSAFCATRPPGHHAEKSKAMGFCFFNNIAIAAAYAKNKYQLSRIAIVDFDVHHGNGTEQFVSGKSEYLFCSSFQHPLYPFSGNDTPTPKNVINTPLSAQITNNDFRIAIQKNWLPALEEFQPEIIFISAGFDAHIEDDISQLNLHESDYRWLTDELNAIANQHSKGRIVSVLEGGYALNALGRCAVAHINGLIGN